jgi:hypothetical protein
MLTQIKSLAALKGAVDTAPGEPLSAGMALVSTHVSPIAL